MKDKKIDVRDLPEAQRPIVHKDHKPPSTRREFLAAGFYNAIGSVMVPGLLSMLSKRAYALECAAKVEDSGHLPFIVMDLGGGANFAMGNVIVGKNGSQENFLGNAAVGKLGVPPDQNPLSDPTMAVNDLKLLFHKNSAFLSGFKSSTSPETRAKMDGVIYCVKSADDNFRNPLNPIFWINQAGAKGQLVDIVGNGGSVGAGNSQSPATSINTASKAKIANAADALSIVNPGLLGSLLPGQTEKILKAAESMSAKRLAAFEKKALPQQVQDLVQCGYIKSIENLTQFGPDKVDPRNDPAVTTVAGIDNTQADPTIPSEFGQSIDRRSVDVVTSISKLVLDGYAGAGTIFLGGYDYHGQGRRTQAIKDFNAGRNAGMAFEMAAIKGKPLVMTFITDGAVSSNSSPDNSPEARGGFSFQSDNGPKSSAFMLVYHPKGVTSTGVRQIGSFTEDGSVDSSTAIGNNIEAFTKAVALNYLALKGEEGTFDKVVKGNPFGADMKKYISFGKLK